MPPSASSWIQTPSSFVGSLVKGQGCVTTPLLLPWNVSDLPKPKLCPLFLERLPTSNIYIPGGMFLARVLGCFCTGIVTGDTANHL